MFLPTRTLIFGALGAMAIPGCLLTSDLGRLSRDDELAPDAALGDEPRDAVAPDGPTTDASPILAPCAASHLFCDDFDTGAIEGRWDQTLTEAGPLAFDTSMFVSPPRSLLATILAAPPSYRATSMRRLVAVPAGRVRFGVDLRTDGPSSPSFRGVDLLRLHFLPLPPDVTSQYVALYETPTRQTFEHSVIGSERTATERPVLVPRGRWVHLGMDADFTQSPPVVSFSVGGVVTATHEVLGETLEAVTIEIGPSYALDVEANWPIFYDNVTVDP